LQTQSGALEANILESERDLSSYESNVITTQAQKNTRDKQTASDISL